MWSQLTQIAAAAAEKAQSVATDLLDEAAADLVSPQDLCCLPPLLPPLPAATHPNRPTLPFLQTEARQQVGSLLQAPAVSRMSAAGYLGFYGCEVIAGCTAALRLYNGRDHCWLLRST